MSNRRAALTEFRRRLTLITKANGYNTDLGKTLFVGERPKLGPDDPPESVEMVIQKDEPSFQGENIVITLPVFVEIVITGPTSGTPWEAREKAIEDVKKAIETDHDLTAPGEKRGTLLRNGLERGPVQPFDQESILIGATIEYRLMYSEIWGQP